MFEGDHNIHLLSVDSSSHYVTQTRPSNGQLATTGGEERYCKVIIWSTTKLGASLKKQTKTKKNLDSP